MLFELPPVIVLYDTEYTAWEGSQERKWTGAHEHREIVEIGAIIVETAEFIETDAIDLYVRPRINPALSDYFINLTKISQDTVDRDGVDFADAWGTFKTWCRAYPAYAFGHDNLVIEENCRLCGVPYDYDGSFHNIRELFDSHGIETSLYTSGTLTKAFGVEPQGSAHNGLSDARSILQGLRLLDQKSAQN